MILRGGLLALPGEEHGVVGDLRISQGRIVEIGEELADDGAVMDARGLVVLPGGIDPHVHFNDPGYTSREDFYCGTCAAAAGGITTVVDMPCTSVPPGTSRVHLMEKLAVVKRKAVVDFGFFGGVSGQSYQDAVGPGMAEMAPSVWGFKTYLTSGMKTFERLNHWQFRSCLERAVEVRRPVLVHAEDFDDVLAATAACARRGDSPRLFYQSRPETAENIAVAAAVEMAEETGASLHVVHVGSARAAALVRDRGAPGRITCETAPHYLQFDVEDFVALGAPLKITPPVKAPENRASLWRFLVEGSIAFVASDHAPCQDKDKKTGSIWTDYSGIPGTGTLMPYLFSEGYLAGRLSLGRLVEVTSGAAARRYGVADRKGALAPGRDADLALFDPGRSGAVSGALSPSKGKITPFEGMTLRGTLVATWLRGEMVFHRDRGVVAPPGTGRFVTPAGA